jgi:hypothetical protein
MCAEVAEPINPAELLRVEFDACAGVRAYMKDGSTRLVSSDEILIALRAQSSDAAFMCNSYLARAEAAEARLAEQSAVTAKWHDAYMISYEQCVARGARADAAEARLAELSATDKYDPEFVKSILNAAAAPPQAFFSNVDDMMAYLNAPEPDDWQTVPVEPTLEMQQAGYNALKLFSPQEAGPIGHYRIYEAMLVAAPAPRSRGDVWAALKEIAEIGRKITDPQNTYGIQMGNIAARVLSAHTTQSVNAEREKDKDHLIAMMALAMQTAQGALRDTGNAPEALAAALSSLTIALDMEAAHWQKYARAQGGANG